ncbi:hypothetical protein Scep_003641 [Stephania cephalantha]|uniref:RRM domain-containing protein n=1 Tax=Stephania cephalantha TaxID=152367 RepID=A0AAP0KSV2_9MAGN
MDESKKRKVTDEEEEEEEEEQEQKPLQSCSSKQDHLQSLLDPLRKDKLLDLLLTLAVQFPTVAEEIRSLASADPVHRKLFVRGLAWDSTSETLCDVFRVHGEIEEGAVILDKVTGKSRGYGFITYKHMESTQDALKEPSKLIDGRLAICSLACEGVSNSAATPDQSQRKLYIGGLLPDTTSEMLLNFFGRHGEIEEGSVAFEKDTNKSRGFGFVTYKTVEAAIKAINHPNKSLGGRNVTVKLADNQKGRAGHPQPPAAMVPVAMSLPATYAQLGKSQVASTPVNYPARYPAVAVYPTTALPNPHAPAIASSPFSALPQMPYTQFTAKKDPFGAYPYSIPNNKIFSRNISGNTSESIVSSPLLQ